MREERGGGCDMERRQWDGRGNRGGVKEDIVLVQDDCSVICEYG